MDKRYTDTEAENLKKVKDAFEDWRNGTGSPFQLLKDEASWTIVGNSVAAMEYKSRKEFIDQVIAPFNARMAKPIVPAIRGIYADGDTVVVLFDASGTAKDGKIYANSYSWFLRFQVGRIDNAIAFFDSIHFNDLWTRVPPQIIEGRIKSGSRSTTSYETDRTSKGGGGGDRRASDNRSRRSRY